MTFIPFTLCRQAGIRIKITVYDEDDNSDDHIDDLEKDLYFPTAGDHQLTLQNRVT